MIDVVTYVKEVKEPERRAARINERLIRVNQHMPKDSFVEALNYNAILIQALREEGVWPPPYST